MPETPSAPTPSCCGRKRCKHKALPWTVALGKPRCLLHQRDAYPNVVQPVKPKKVRKAKKRFGPSVTVFGKRPRNPKRLP